MRVGAPQVMAWRAGSIDSFHLLRTRDSVGLETSKNENIEANNFLGNFTSLFLKHTFTFRPFKDKTIITELISDEPKQLQFP